MQDKGFQWDYPTHAFSCATWIEDTSSVTGWKQYFVTTASHDCKERFWISRAIWWSNPYSYQVTLTVGADPATLCATSKFWDGQSCTDAMPIGDIVDIANTATHVKVPLNYNQLVTLKEFE